MTVFQSYGGVGLREVEALTNGQMPPVHVDLVTVTPEMAQALLEKAAPNRSRRKSRAELFARDMETGNWLVNGESIKIDAEGRVVDGQHRLAGCVIAKVPFQTFIAYGVPFEDAIDTVDSGVKRTAGDALKLHGFSSATDRAATIRAIHCIRMKSRTLVLSHRDVVKFAHEHEAELDQALSVTRKLNVAVRAPRGAMGACYYEFAQRDGDLADEFFRHLTSGANLAETDPIFLLRKRFEVEMVSSTAKSMDWWYFVAIAIKAWNAWIAGAEKKNLRWRRAGSERESFPEIQEPE